MRSTRCSSDRGRLFRAVSSPAFETGTDYRPIGFVDAQIPPGPGALGHVSDISVLLAASGAQAVALCGYLTDKQFRDVVDAALAGGCQVLAYAGGRDRGVHPTRCGGGAAARAIDHAESQGTTARCEARARSDRRGGRVGGAEPHPGLSGRPHQGWISRSVFFTQERVGRGGRHFKIYKLRTMVDGAEAKRDELLSQSVYGDPRLFKMPRDPRMTRWVVGCGARVSTSCRSSSTSFAAKCRWLDLGPHSPPRWRATRSATTHASMSGPESRDRGKWRGETK